jgi:hypothetical protein
MKIDLCDGKYTLKSDAHCMWISEIKINKKTGAEYEENISGYHPTFESLIASLFRKRILLSEAETLEALGRDIDVAARDLKEIVAELKEFFAATSSESNNRKKRSQS